MRGDRGTLRWVRYEPARMMLDALRLSPRAELAHRRLADGYWQEGAWAFAASAPRVCRVGPGAWESVLKELRGVGWKLRGGRLTHSWVHWVRAEAAAARRLAKSTGRVGGQQRWARQRARAAATSSSGPQNGQKAPDRPPIAPLIGPTYLNTVQYSTINKAFNAERLTPNGSALSTSARKNAAGEEREFLEGVAGLFGPKAKKRSEVELANWGGWWRNRFRENPEKARRVLAEVAGLVREGKIRTAPGAAAFDLWQRLP